MNKVNLQRAFMLLFTFHFSLFTSYRRVILLLFTFHFSLFTSYLRVILLLFTFHFSLFTSIAKSYDNPDTIVVARDGTGEFRNISEAVEVCRAFMDYHKVIFVKRGVYKEKIVIPQSLTNIEICGEDRDNTIITWDDLHHPQEHHRREQCRPTGTGSSPVHRWRQTHLRKLPLPGSSGHHLYGQCPFTPTVQGLLHRGHHRLHLRSCHRLVRALRHLLQGRLLHHSSLHPAGRALRLRVQQLSHHGCRGCYEGLSGTPLARLWLHPLHELRPAPPDTSRGMAPLAEEP